MNYSGKVIAMATLVFAATTAAKEHGHWGYEGEHAPQHWGKTYVTCGTGVNQSPINIDHSVEAELIPPQFHYQGQVSQLVNNGHTLQAKVNGSNQLELDGQLFQLKQFHFHTPSENTIKGQHFPLEAHFVHQDSEGNLAVVTVMFAQGNKHPSLAKLIATLPAVDQTVDLSQPFAVQALLAEREDYYRFNGSLTTPPCSEGVRWLVLAEPLQASQAQIEAMHQVMGSNNRPVQALNARIILDGE